MPESYLFFTPETAATFRGAAGCILPSAPGSPGADSDAAMRIADRVLSSRPERDRRLLTTFLKAVEFLPRLRYGRGFSFLRREEQEGFLRFLEDNRVGSLRQGFFGIKTFALLGYYAQDATWRESGYPGPRTDAPYYELRAKGG